MFSGSGAARLFVSAVNETGDRREPASAGFPNTNRVMESAETPFEYAKTAERPSKAVIATMIFGNAFRDLEV